MPLFGQAGDGKTPAVSASEVCELFSWQAIGRGRGWPATMEGAVRSGYLAAEAVTRAAGNRFILVPDISKSGLAQSG